MTETQPHERPLSVALVDKGGEVALKFLAREARTRGGQIVAIKSGVARLNLSEAKKEIAVWGGGDAHSAMITAEGYRAIQAVAQITVLTPPSIEVPAKGVQANPYVLTDERTGQFRGGWVRKIAVAPGPLGNLVLTDRTTYLTLYEYLVEDLIGVAKRNPAAVLWGSRPISPADLIEGAIEEHNADLQDRIDHYKRKGWKTDKLERSLLDAGSVKKVRRDVKRGLWDFFEIEPLTGTGLWFDRTASAVQTVFRTYAQTGKFGLRKLEAIAFRNVMRDHPLTPGMSLDADKLREIRKGEGDRAKVVDRIATVPVFFHEQVEGEEEIRELFRTYEAGLRTASLVSLPAGAEADREVEPERVSVSDANAGTGAEDDGDGVEELDERSSPEEVSQGDTRGGLIAQIRQGEDILADPDAVQAIREQIPEIAEKGLRASTSALEAYQRRIMSAVNTRDDSERSDA